jgi:hypothetical protein
MDSSAKVVTRLPLQELCREDGLAAASRIRWLTADDVRSLLRAGHVHFVVADVGTSLRWIPLSECYDFWKTEVEPHLAVPDSRASLDDFPDGYCYFVCEWSSRDGASPIIVCERQH